MRILFFVSERDFGLGTLMAKQAIAFNALHNIEFLYITGGTEKEAGLFKKLDDNNVNYKRINGLEYHRNFLRLVRLTNSIVKTFRPDIVHVQTNWQLAIVLVVKYLFFHKFKLVYTVHGFRNNNKLKSLIFRAIISVFFLLFVKRIVVCSSYVGQKFRLVKQKIALLFLGVDPIYLDKLSSAFYNDDDSITFYYPAIFRKGKNQDKLIRAFATILKENETNKKLQLILPGEGEYKTKCIEIVNNLGIADNVIFPGFLSKEKLIHYLSKNCIAVIPSESETFGLCIAEPYAYGNCVVSKNVGVASDIIINGENGYTYQADSELIAILKQLTNHPNQIRECGRNARLNNSVLDWNNIAIQYQSIISNVDKKQRTRLYNQSRLF